MRVFGTVGLPGSGKGEVAAVAREEGIPVVTMGDVIREECRERGLDPAEHHGTVAGRLREEEGPDAIAARTLPRVEAALADHDTVLVDGLRSGVELDRFVEAFGEDFVLVSVEAPFEVRAERLLDRGRDDSDLDREALREREERELGFGMDEAMARADVVVENTGTVEAFRDCVRTLLRDGPATLREDPGLSGETETGDGVDETDPEGPIAVDLDAADAGGEGDSRADRDDATAGELRERRTEAEDGGTDR